jgi:TPR repeat protein
MTRGACVKPFVAAAVGVIVLSCRVAHAWTAEQESAPPPASQTSRNPADTHLQTVTIKGARSARELERQAHHFVTSEVFQPPDEPVARWNIAICPRAQGLPAAFNDFLQTRVEQIASSAGAPVAGKHCGANFYVFATFTPDPLLKKLLAVNPEMYDARNGLGGVNRFMHSERPVRIWYNAELQCRNSHSAGASVLMKGAGGGGGQRGNSAVDTTSTSFCSGGESRLSYAVANSISTVYIVVDMNRVKGITTIQLADYIAMIGLAYVRPNADSGATPSILQLFKDERPPRGLSKWDQALLYSLYNTTQSSVVQTSEMESTVIARISGAFAGSNSAIPDWANEPLPQRDAKITYWYLVDAEQGSAAAQYDLGIVNFKGEGVPQDYAKAAQWFRQAAEQGHVRAQYNLGAMYALGEGVPQDYAQAAEWFRKAAQQGNVDAQSRLASAYANGEGVPQDDAQAAQWYRMAAAQGDINAQNNLGAIYYGGGQGVPRDYAQAVHWYRAAAEQGNTAAQYNLGVMYFLGQGISQDDASADQWFRKAAEKGDPNAQRSLGLAYAQGRGVPRDFAQAAQWFSKAADQGNADAQFFLGSMYNRGLGVQHDEVTAYKWWMVAKADSNSSEDAYDRAVYRLKTSASEMTPEQIALAHREASEWLAAHQSAR